MIERESPPFSASMAVVDGMKQAVSMQIIRRAKIQPLFSREQVQSTDYQLHAEQFLKKATISNCYESSQNTLVYVYQRYRDMFDTYMVLGTFEDELYGQHGVFLLHETQGDWFTGSPANYPVEPLFDRPLQAPTLSGILDQLAKASPGKWPSEAVVQSTIEEHTPLVPVYTPKLHYEAFDVPILENQYGHITFFYNEHATERTLLKLGKRTQNL